MAANRHIASFGLMGALALSLAGCGGESLKDVLGYGKNAPDEFAIVTKAPLVIPPDFSLRPPTPGAPRPQEASPDAMARAALVGDDGTEVASLGSGSAGEQTLLNQAGATQADPNIRAVVNNESNSLTEKDAAFVDDVVSYKGAEEPPAHVVDAPAEARRIQANEAQGESVSQGDTPMVEEEAPNKKGWLSRTWDGIF
jgi:hypothetical protein